MIKISYDQKKRLYDELGYTPHPRMDKDHKNWDLVGQEHPSMQEFHASSARFKALVAGSRFGKSYGAAMEVLPIIFWPRTRGWIVAPSYDLGEKEFAYLWESIVIKLRMNPPRKSYDPRSGRMFMKLVNGSTVRVKSVKNPEDLLGDEIDWVILSEASQIKEIIWQRYIRQRLISREGVCVVPFTPAGDNWVKQTFYDLGQNGDVNYWSHIYPAIVNPFYPRKEWLDAQKKLPPNVFQEQYMGDFVRFSGLVYGDFDHQTHIIEPFDIPSYWTRIMAVDPHPNTPTAVLWMAVAPDGAKYLYDELYVGGKTVSEIAQIIWVKEETAHIVQTKAKEKDNKISYRLMDMRAAHVKQTILGTADIDQQFQREGFFFLKGSGDFESAYQLITKDLRFTRIDAESNEVPSLFVFKNLEETIYEFEHAVWDEYVGRKERDAKNKPRQLRVHMLDCLKYIYNSNPGWVDPERHEKIKKRRDKRIILSRVGGY